MSTTFTKVKYYKVLSADFQHYDHTYTLGLNIDKVPFNPKGECQPGGLYFTTFEHIHLYFWFGTFVAEVTIPDDAQLYNEGNKSKADKIIISNIVTIREFIIAQGYEWYMDKLKNTISILENCPIEWFTTEHLQFAIDGSKEKYILVGVNENLFTREICLEMIKIHPHNLQYIPKNKMWYKLVCQAVKKHGCVIKFVTYHLLTPELKKYGKNCGAYVCRVYK
jgi:hypothetical protein